jgi:putative endonuclease
MKKYHVYIMANPHNTVLYTGVTSNLEKRVLEHKSKIQDGFTRKYNITKLVYAEEYREVLDAIQREKQIKAGSRKKKLALIKSINPAFSDLSVL